MPTETESPSQACWSQDRPDSLAPPLAEPPYFDATLDAWVFSRYADIVTALRVPSLVPASVRNRAPQPPLDREQHRRMRAETFAALPASQLRTWKKHLAGHAEELVHKLPEDRPVDLLAEYAHPLCLSIAATVTRIQHDEAIKLCPKARLVSTAAADPYNAVLRSAANSADAELRPCFPADGPESLRDLGFVALSQTLPALLGNTWFALLEHPEQWQRLHLHPGLIKPAIEELMRYAGFTRTVTRLATADVRIGETHIHKDQRIVLRLVAANRDPVSFPQPNQIDFARRVPGHLSFGAGLHACVGARLLRMIALTLTSSLLSRFAEARLAGEISWEGGATFLTPQRLRVHLRR